MNTTAKLIDTLYEQMTGPLHQEQGEPVDFAKRAHYVGGTYDDTISPHNLNEAVVEAIAFQAPATNWPQAETVALRIQKHLGGLSDDRTIGMINDAREAGLVDYREKDGTYGLTDAGRAIAVARVWMEQGEPINFGTKEDEDIAAGVSTSKEVRTSIDEALLAAVARYHTEDIEAPQAADIADACDIGQEHIDAAIAGCKWLDTKGKAIVMTPEGMAQAAENGWLDEEPEAAAEEPTPEPPVTRWQDMEPGTFAMTPSGRIRFIGSQGTNRKDEPITHTRKLKYDGKGRQRGQVSEPAEWSRGTEKGEGICTPITIEEVYGQPGQPSQLLNDNFDANLHGPRVHITTRMATKASLEFLAIGPKAAPKASKKGAAPSCKSDTPPDQRHGTAEAEVARDEKANREAMQALKELSNAELHDVLVAEEAAPAASPRVIEQGHTFGQQSPGTWVKTPTGKLRLIASQRVSNTGALSSTRVLYEGRSGWRRGHVKASAPCLHTADCLSEEDFAKHILPLLKDGEACTTTERHHIKVTPIAKAPKAAKKAPKAAAKEAKAPKASPDKAPKAALDETTAQAPTAEEFMALVNEPGQRRSQSDAALAALAEASNQLVTAVEGNYNRIAALERGHAKAVMSARISALEAQVSQQAHQLEALHGLLGKLSLVFSATYKDMDNQ